MIEKLRIRLADWRDREVIQPLRRLLGRPVDGGLFELLNWPMYHAHIAMLDGQAVGFTAVVLNMGGVADDVGTVTHPDFRRQGIASELRYTQVRDLITMGFGTLFCASPLASEAAIKWCEGIIGNSIGEIDSPVLPKHAYFGNNLTAIESNLRLKKIRRPFPLSDMNHERLIHKVERAIRDAASLQAVGDFNIRKAVLREQLR